MYSYQIYSAQNHSNERVNNARESFGKKHLDCYVILKDGQMQVIQFEDYLPYPAVTLEESARSHIESLDEMDRIAQMEADARNSVSEELLEEILKRLKTVENA